MNNKLVISIPTLILILIAVYVFPWRKINWGTLRLGPEKVITVTGTSKSQELNQIARFTAGVTAINDDKDTAVSEVETKIAELIQAIKDFGIEDKDIKTESLRVYQQEEPVLDRGTQKTQPGQWRVNNSVSITLRDITRASELTSLLTDKGTTDLYGPNFTLDDTKNIETKLMQSAIDNAREKAETVAKSQGLKIKEMISVTEGYQEPGYMSRLEGLGGGGSTIEPGSSTVSKTVTVTFSIKP